MEVVNIEFYKIVVIVSILLILMYTAVCIVWTKFRLYQRNIKNEMQSIKNEIISIIKEFTKINKR